MDNLDWQLTFDDAWGETPELPRVEEPKKKKEKFTDPNEEKHIEVSHRMGYRNQARKISSEKSLEERMPWHLEEGDSIHCFSFGDVDSFTFLKMIARQQKINYLALSTWCMAGEDIKELENWHRRGIIGRVDFFLGEIFKGSYPDAYQEAQRFIKQCGGRLVIFRNHSKVMAIEGDRFDCLIESSANVNTNPRSENTVITVDKELTQSYIQLFSEIQPFNRDECGAEPYRREENK